MPTPDDPNTTQRPLKDLGQRLRSERAVAIAFIASVALHGLFWLFFAFAAQLNLPFAMSFSESAGIGMMNRVGRVFEGAEFQTAPRYTSVDLTPPPAPLGPAAPTDEERAQMQSAQEAAAAEAAALEAAAREAEAQAEAARQAQREAEQAAAAERRARRAEEQRQAQARADVEAAERAAAEARAAADAAAAEAPPEGADPSGREDGQAGGVGDEGTPDAGPDLSLPPGERYPAGTINPIATDLGMWGPEGARLVVVTRNDRLRSSPHAQSVRNLLQAFPDWRTLVGGADIDPLRDIDAMVVASSDPRYINRTFLAAVHHMPTERVVRTLSQGQHGGVAWEQNDGRLIGRPTPTQGVDPRVFFVPTEKIFVFSRPEFMDALQGRAPTPRGMDDAIALTQLSAEAFAEAMKEEAEAEKLRPQRADDEPPLRNAGWLRGLLDIADYGGTGAQGPAVMISTGRIDDMRIQGYRGTMPQGFHANVFAGANVDITARAIFANKSDAEGFMRAWPGIVDANRSALTITGLYRPLADAELSVDHNETIIAFSIPQATVRRLGVTVSQMMQMR